MTKEKIAAAAAKQIEAEGIGAFSSRKLAKSLGVAPTTVFAHFKSGHSLDDEIVRASLGAVARPFKPNEAPGDYLRDLFFEVLKALKGRPTVATLILLRLSGNPALLPQMAERILAGLAALPVPDEKIAWAFERTMKTLFTMILAAPVRSQPAAQNDVAARIKATVSSLPVGEFPNMAAFGDALSNEAGVGATEDPTPAVAQAYVDRLIAEFTGQ